MREQDMTVSQKSSDVVRRQDESAIQCLHVDATDLQFHPFKGEGQILSFCDVPTTRSKLDAVCAAFEVPNRLPIVVGAPGLGKTTLMRQLSMARHRRSVMVQASAGLNASNLLKRLALAAELPLLNRLDPPMAQAETMLDQLQDREIKLTVMIDDADRLPLQTLAVLVHCLAKQADAPVRTVEILMLGQATLVERAQSLTLGGDQGIHVEPIVLQPFQQDDIAHYCFSRMRSAGWRGMMPAISKHDSAAIMERTAGLPSALNTVIAEHYFPIWVASKVSGDARQARIDFIPEARNRFVRFFSVLTLGGLMAWMTIAPAWAMQYGSWVQACQNVTTHYVSVSDFLVHKIAHVLI
jgi:type II secretory pathway predicted ATPase ExeA